MKYAIISEFDNAKLTVETNDVYTACTEFLLRAEDASHVYICDGFTGEVLARTGDEPYCTDEMALMLLGHLMVEAWGEKEDEEEEPPREVIPSIFEVMTALSEQMAEELEVPQIKCMVCGLPQ